MARADRFTANPHWLPPNPGRLLDHIPGEDGWPVVGTTLRLLADPPGYVRRMHATAPFSGTRALAGAM